jgi:HlyD family secretion protein
MNKQSGPGETGSKDAPQIVPFPAAERAAREPAAQKSGTPVSIGAVVALCLRLRQSPSGGRWRQFANSLCDRARHGGPIIAALATGTNQPRIDDHCRDVRIQGPELSCDYNARVKRSQSCAKIDPRPYQAWSIRKNEPAVMAQLRRTSTLVYAKLTGRHATLVR